MTAQPGRDRQAAIEVTNAAGQSLPRPHWQARAVCRDTNPNRWYLRDHEARVTDWHRDHCYRCPVLPDCAADALDHRDEGVVRAAVALNKGTRSRERLVDRLAEAGAVPA